jgi:hypothetical protein
MNESETHAAIASGEEIAPSMTIRCFLSSTFADFRTERPALRICFDERE